MGKALNLAKSVSGQNDGVNAALLAGKHIDEITVDVNLDDYLTPLPEIDIDGSVNENTSIGGILTNYSKDTIYTITAHLGTIDYQGEDTFTYNAPDITDGDDDTDTISIVGIQAGMLRSKSCDISIDVIYVNTEADDSYIDDLSEDDSTYNDNWEVQ